MTATTNTCWADPLTAAERRLVAVKLANACHRLWEAGYAPAVGSDRPYWHHASHEMQDLHLDVTERAEVPAS
jgi:hypothetical protein